MKTLFALLATITFSFAFGQDINATTDDGKKVILKSDGTWEYVEEKPSENTSATAADCSKYIAEDTDEVTGKSYVSAAEMVVVSRDGGKKGFGIYNMLGSKGNSIIMSIQAVGAGNCIDDDDKINIVFRDGSRLELINQAKFNCDAKASLYFGGVFGQKKELEQFCSKEVKIMRVWTSDGYVEETFDSEQSKQLMNTMKCLKERF